MKKTLKLAVVMLMFATPAMAANLENPLYLPEAGGFYSQTGAGLMIKRADSSNAQKMQNHAGAVEFPLFRVQENLGIGVTDRFAIRGSFMYTHDDDIGRKGLNRGRFGIIGRVWKTSNDIMLDLYADAHLAGIHKMQGSYTLDKGFHYDNYTNGRWGINGGLRFGKKWNKLTTSAFVEVLQTFGNHNNVIDVTELKLSLGPAGEIPITALGVPEKISVNLKPTTEINAGLETFYQINSGWSVGGGLTYNHHADNGVKSLASKMNPAAAPIADKIIKKLSNMDDGFDEYILSLSVARQMTNWLQLALYGEYTFDTAHANSQSGSDAKAEAGLRLNLSF